MVQPAMPTKRIALDDLPLSFTTPLSVSTGSLAALRGTRAIAMQRSHGSQLAQTGLEGRVKALNSSPRMTPRRRGHTARPCHRGNLVTSTTALQEKASKTANKVQALHHVRPRVVDDVSVVQPSELLVWRCMVEVAMRKPSRMRPQ